MKMGTLSSVLKSMLGLGVSDPSSEVSPQEASARLKASKIIQLVDVRSPEEYQQMRIAGSKLIPLHDLGSRSREIDKIKPVLLYCHSGARSGMALNILKGKGYSQIAHISGGISAWKRNGLPVVTN